jgi:hypothetical protein
MKKSILLVLLFSFIISPKIWGNDDPLRLPFKPDEFDTVNERWNGLYFGNKKIGYMHVRIEKIIENNNTYLCKREYNEFNAIKNGVKTKYTQLDVKKFEMIAPYSLVYAYYRKTKGEFLKEITIKNGKSNFKVNIRDGQESQETFIDFIDYTLEDLMTDELWIRQKPANNSFIFVRVFDYDDLEVKKSKLQAVDKKNIILNGIKQAIYEVTMTDYNQKKIYFKMNSRGEVIFVSDGEFIEFRKETQEQATNIDYQADLFISGQIHVDKPLGQYHTIENLVLEIQGETQLDFPKSINQSISYNKENKIFTIKLGRAYGEKKKATQKEISEALKKTIRYPIDNPLITKLANEITLNCQSFDEKVSKLVSFVDRYIEDDLNAEPLSVLDILRIKKGDCTEHALLFTALARAAKIPAREVGGMIYMGDDAQAFGGHQWNEVVINGEWIPVDAAFGETDINNTHILLKDDDFSSFKSKEFRVKELNLIDQDILHDIGDHGTKIKLDRLWTRKTIEPSLGKNQFIYTPGIFLCAIEIEQLLLKEKNFEETAQKYLDMIALKFPKYTILKKEFQKSKGFDHYILKFTAVINGFDIIYRIDIAGRKGLNYIIMSWASPLIKDYDEKIDQAINGISFPQTDSSWAKSFEPIYKNFELGDFNFKMAYIPGYFQEINIQGMFFALQSYDNLNSIFFIDLPGENNPELLMKNVYEVLKKDLKDLTPPNIISIKINGQEAVQSDFYSAQYNLFIKSTVLQLAPEHLIEVRFASSAKSDAMMEILQNVFNSFSIEKIADILDAFPKDQSSDIDNMKSPVLLKNKYFWDNAKLITKLPEYAIWCKKTSMGWVFGNSRKCGIIPLGSNEVHLIHNFDQWSTISTGIFENQLYINGGEDEVIVYKDGQVSKAGFTCSKIIGRYNSFLYYIKSENIKSYFDYSKIIKNKIYRRDKNGNEELCYELDGWIHFACISGDRILIDRNPMWFDKKSDMAINLGLLSIPKKTFIPFDGWEFISDIQAIDSGWLITGTRNGQNGLFYMDDNQNVTQLISDTNYKGVTYNNTDLMVVSPSLSSQINHGVYLLNQKNLADMKVQPKSHDGKSIRELANATFKILNINLYDSQSLATWESIENAYLMAQKLSREKGYLELPTTADEFDDLIKYMYSDIDLMETGITLLTIDFIYILKNQGAQWIESNCSLINNNSQNSYIENPFNIAYFPYQIVWSAIYNPDEWMNPLQTITEMNKGRQVIMGNCLNEINKVLDSSYNNDLVKVIKNLKQKPIIKFLNIYKNNTYLRNYIYLELLKQKKSKIFEKVINPFIHCQEPNLMDLKYWLRYVYENKKGVKDSLYDMNDMKALIRRFPKEGLFYIMLGKQYLEGKFENKEKLALVCFKKAEELNEVDLKNIIENEIKNIKKN